LGLSVISPKRGLKAFSTTPPRRAQRAFLAPLPRTRRKANRRLGGAR
jgi:hypothetical protein